MRTWAIPAGHLFGIELRIHIGFLLPLFFMASVYPQLPSGVAGILGMVAVATLIHQFVLAFLARQAGAVPKAIIVLPVGGLIILNDLPGHALTDADRQREVRMALLGPLVYLLLAAVSAVVIAASTPDVIFRRWPLIHPASLARSVVWVNLLLAAINLIPAYPLDAGRLLRAIFTRRADLATATRRAVSVAHSLALVFMVLGMVLYATESTRPRSAWFFMLGFFIFIGAQLEERAVFLESVLESVRLDEIMLTEFATLSPADTLEDALQKAIHTLQEDFPVVRGSDLVGSVSRQAIVNSLRSEGNGYVQAVMIRLVEAANAGESLASAFRRLNARKLNLVPVVENERLVGIVTRQNLMHSMSLLAESRRLRQAEKDDE
jgi:CBS domain-containing protein/Zn-dependent protease